MNLLLNNFAIMRWVHTYINSHEHTIYDDEDIEL